MSKGTYLSDDPVFGSDTHTLMLIGHQSLQLLRVAVQTNDRVFDVPTPLAAARIEYRDLMHEIQADHPDRRSTDRFGLNAMGDKRGHGWIQAAGKRKLVVAGLWAEVCLSMPVMSALADEYDVYIVSYASGGGSTEAHELAVRRMIHAGARPVSLIAYLCELQRDRANADTAEQLASLFVRQGGCLGQGERWESPL